MLAEVGVVLLMFSIGVEFSIPDLLRVKWVALVGAPIGILIMLGVAIVAGKFFGWSTTEGFAIGAAVSVASTMVLARLLSDTGRLATTYGRVMIAITLVEDLAVICMTVVIPVFGSAQRGGLLMAAWVLGKAVLLLDSAGLSRNKSDSPLSPASQKQPVTRNFSCWLRLPFASGRLRWHKQSDSPSRLEHFSPVYPSVACLSFMMLTPNWFPCGMPSWRSFFVSLGTLIDPAVLLHSLPLLGLMLLLIVGGKFLVWSVVVWLFRYPLKTAILVAAGLTQIGELSFVVMQAARSAGMVAENVFSTVIAASLISILLNVFIVRGTFKWVGRTTGLIRTKNEVLAPAIQ